MNTQQPIRLRRKSPTEEGHKTARFEARHLGVGRFRLRRIGYWVFIDTLLTCGKSFQRNTIGHSNALPCPVGPDSDRDICRSPDRNRDLRRIPWQTHPATDIPSPCRVPLSLTLSVSQVDKVDDKVDDKVAARSMVGKGNRKRCPVPSTAFVPSSW